MQPLRELEALGMRHLDMAYTYFVDPDGVYEVSTDFAIFRFSKGEKPDVLNVFYRMHERNPSDVAMFEVSPGIACTDMYVEIHGDQPRWETMKTIALRSEPWDG